MNFIPVCSLGTLPLLSDETLVDWMPAGNSKITFKGLGVLSTRWFTPGMQRTSFSKWRAIVSIIPRCALSHPLKGGSLQDANYMSMEGLYKKLNESLKVRVLVTILNQ